MEEIERLLCERYSVAELDGPLKGAIDAGDVESLRSLIAERELYRWREPIEAALAELAESAAVGTPPLVPTAAPPEQEAMPEEQPEQRKATPSSAKQRR